jgi:hypothetical protein
VTLHNYQHRRGQSTAQEKVQAQAVASYDDKHDDKRDTLGISRSFKTTNRSAGTGWSEEICALSAQDKPDLALGLLRHIQHQGPDLDSLQQTIVEGGAPCDLVASLQLQGVAPKRASSYAYTATIVSFFYNRFPFDLCPCIAGCLDPCRQGARCSIAVS